MNGPSVFSRRCSDPLTDERWVHIVENHDDLAGYRSDVLQTIESPYVVLHSDEGVLIAARQLQSRRHLAGVDKVLSPTTGVP
jgi:hypothetical protein